MKSLCEAMGGGKERVPLVAYRPGHRLGWLGWGRGSLDMKGRLQFLPSTLKPMAQGESDSQIDPKEILLLPCKAQENQSCTCSLQKLKLAPT